MEIVVTHRSLKQTRNLLIIALMLLAFLGFSTISRLKSEEKSTSNKLDSLMQFSSMVESDLKGYTNMEERWLKYRVEQAFIDLTKQGKTKLMEPTLPSTPISIDTPSDPVELSPFNDDKRAPNILSPLPSRGTGLIETKINAPKPPSADKAKIPSSSKDGDIQAMKSFIETLKTHEVFNNSKSRKTKTIAIDLEDSDVSRFVSSSNNIYLFVDGTRTPAKISKVNNKNFLVIEYSLDSLLSKNNILLQANGASLKVNKKNLVMLVN